jgi:transposase, IS30 family
MNHLESCERRSIEHYLKKKRGVRWIARALERSPSSVSTEIKLGSVRGKYQADKAQKKAELRRKQSKQKCLKVAMNPVLKTYVIKQLEADQSPEGIAGRIKDVDKHVPYASQKAIYNFVYSPHGRPLECHLYSKRIKKKGGPKRGSTKASDTTKTSIEERSEVANKRLEFGHFEGDYIESGKDGIGSLLVLVERKTRYTLIAYTEAKTTLHINSLIHQMLGDIPLKSLTLDNDISFQKHEALSQLIGVTVYFTRPYTSSDKGAVENRNKRIREFVPKGCDISKVSKETIRLAETKLNHCFMKCLGFKAPQEAWDEEIARVKIKKITPVVVIN